MIPNIRTLYSPGRAAATFAYMLQNTEYAPGAYLRWFWRTQNFSQVIYRRTLDATKAARMLKRCLTLGMSLQLFVGVLFLLLGFWQKLDMVMWAGVALAVSYPVVWAHLVVVPLLLARELYVKPRQARQVVASRELFARHKGVKIAVAGSYGKTSMKELLATVLGEGLRVAATPANKNVAVSHAVFARGLNGNEDALIIEYGEGRPGDVARFAANTQPTHGIITGLAPAHLDQYKTLQAAGEDIFSLADYLHGKHVYVNTEPAAVAPFLKDTYRTYDATGALGWKVSQVHVGVHGTDFILSKGGHKLQLHSGLLGVHNLGPLTLAAALGMELGLSPEQARAGIAKTTPHEHRMQPREVGGAWVIDDTYNGNLEGIRAGLMLLTMLQAKRKVYVTPGLVDQGAETRAVHEEIGRLIAQASPDVVVLMQNSVTPYIQAGLTEGKFAGEVRSEPQPLEFYQNLTHFVAAGDLVLMQNDWPDNYR